MGTIPLICSPPDSLLPPDGQGWVWNRASLALHQGPIPSAIPAGLPPQVPPPPPSHACYDCCCLHSHPHPTTEAPPTNTPSYPYPDHRHLRPHHSKEGFTHPRPEQNSLFLSFRFQAHNLSVRAGTQSPHSTEPAAQGEKCGLCWRHRDSCLGCRAGLWKEARQTQLRA